MKKFKALKKSLTFQPGNIYENPEKDIIQSIGSYQDFLIIEKKDNINKTHLEFEKVESDNNFLNDFLILQRRPQKEKSRFTELFKEIKEQEEKNLIEEPKVENNEEPKEENNEINEQKIPPSNPQSLNSNFDTFDRNPSYFSISQYQNQKIENPKFNNKDQKPLNNIMFNFSNSNSRSTSDSGFTGHGSSFSIKSTKTIFSNYPNNNFYKRNSIHSGDNNNIINNNINNNIINNHINNPNINNNNNIISNNMNNNNNIFNIFPNNLGNMNIIYNNSSNTNYSEKEFEPNVDMKKILTFEDKRTTIMIKNIPNKFTREKLLELIDKNFKGTYDLFILPKDGNKNRNFGYSFINFISSYYIPYFYSVFNSKKWTDTNSQKVCEITYSKFQGRNELIAHYPSKIIFFNDAIDFKNRINNDFFIPNEYKLLFKQIYPNQQIEEKESGFITKIPYIF